MKLSPHILNLKANKQVALFTGNRRAVDGIQKRMPEDADWSQLIRPKRSLLDRLRRKKKWPDNWLEVGKDDN